MLLPTKYEKLSSNTIVIGAEIISCLKNRPYNIEVLYQVLKEKININIEQYFNCLAFLWLAEGIVLQNYELHLKKEK